MASYETLEKRVSILEENCKKSRSGKIAIPLPCQASVRNVLATCMKKDGLLLTYTSKEDDQDAMKKVVRETRRLYSDAGWGEGTCEAAFWKVWKNRKDDKAREETGKKAQHRENALAHKRRSDKLKSRLQCLQTIGWSERKKAEVLPLLTKALTSPIKDDPLDHNLLTSIPWCWASNKLNRRKQALDDERTYRGTPSQRARRKLWVRSTTETTQQETPEGLPAWAVL